MTEEKKPSEEGTPQPGDPDYIPPMPEKGGPKEDIADASDTDTEEMTPPHGDTPSE